MECIYENNEPPPETLYTHALERAHILTVILRGTSALLGGALTLSLPLSLSLEAERASTRAFTKLAAPHHLACAIAPSMCEPIGYIEQLAKSSPSGVPPQRAPT